MAGDKQIKLCDCKSSSRLDAAALGKAAGSGKAITFHSELCRSEIEAADTACRSGDEVIIGCTQESTLFSELAADAGAEDRLRFVNLREFAGRSAEGANAVPKMAALIAAAQLPEVEPVAGFNMQSSGNLLIVGEAGVALGWAERLRKQLTVTVLMTGRSQGAELPVAREYPIFSGRVTRCTGHLGRFDLAWVQENPIDLEQCVR